MSIKFLFEHFWTFLKFLFYHFWTFLINLWISKWVPGTEVSWPFALLLQLKFVEDRSEILYTLYLIRIHSDYIRNLRSDPSPKPDIHTNYTQYFMHMGLAVTLCSTYHRWMSPLRIPIDNPRCFLSSLSTYVGCSIKAEK